MEEKESSFKTNSGFTGLLNGVEYGRHTTHKNNHPTVKPLSLMKYLITLVTPPSGIVLDPFLGSGTTLVAAKELGFSGRGIENDPEYFKIAEARIANTKIKDGFPGK